MKSIIRCSVLVIALLFSVSAFAQDKDIVKFYDTYIAAVIKAKSIDDITPFIASESLADRDQMTKEDEEFFLEFLKENRKTTKRKSIETKVDGDKATITVKAIDTTNNSPVTGAIDLIKEDGKWKILQEYYDQDVNIMNIEE